MCESWKAGRDVNVTAEGMFGGMFAQVAPSERLPEWSIELWVY